MARSFAQLIEDGGASAGGDVGGHPTEFFRGAHFLEAEGATHTLRIETDEAELLAPLIVREIEGRAPTATRSPRTATPVSPSSATSPRSSSH